MVRPLLNDSDGRRPRRARPLAHRDPDEHENEHQPPTKAIKTRPRTSVHVASAAPAAVAHDAVRRSCHDPPDRSPSCRSQPPNQSTRLHAPSSRLALTRRHQHLAAVTKAVVAPGGRPAPAHTATTRPTANNLPRTRPPTRVTVSRPNGDLVRATNGVEKPLSIRENTLDPGAASETAKGKTTLAVPQSHGNQENDKRSLRSQAGGSRLKSDLSIYFGNYDEVISGEQKEPDFLGLDTPIYISDEHAKGSKSAGAAQQNLPSQKTGKATSPDQSSTTSSKTFNGFPRVDFSSVNRLATRGTEDPLPDDLYFKPHRRAERKEKQLRNIEKERAMHEKVQLERLLDGLQGHDWLRVMGVTGITDTEKKDFEPKRDYFVREVRALVDKFRIWKEEEKRLRSEREEREKEHAAREEAEQAEDEQKDEEDDAVEFSELDANGDPPADSDVDAWAARQLLQEANSAQKLPSLKSRAKAKFSKVPAKGKAPTQARSAKARGQDVSAPVEEDLNKPFTSFFSKPWERDAALNKHRHSDRRLLAFGQPIPDMDEREFKLPSDLLDPEYLKQHERERRRRKRDRESGTSGSKRQKTK